MLLMSTHNKCYLSHRGASNKYLQHMFLPHRDVSNEYLYVFMMNWRKLCCLLKNLTNNLDPDQMA